MSGKSQQAVAALKTTGINLLAVIVALVSFAFGIALMGGIFLPLSESLKGAMTDFGNPFSLLFAAVFYLLAFATPLVLPVVTFFLVKKIITT